MKMKRIEAQLALMREGFLDSGELQKYLLCSAEASGAGPISSFGRRDFLRKAGLVFAAAAGTGLAPGLAGASEQAAGGNEFIGVLVDTTRCIGCRRCEQACAGAHSLPLPATLDDNAVFEKPRKTSPTQLTVIDRRMTERGPVYVKKQCMHCNQPACAAACLVKAMEKKQEGPVVWNPNCMGCRICMVSCPFDVPMFEYDKTAPKLQKCDMCWNRLTDAKQPACVEACPTEALVFGTRRQLVVEAQKRMAQFPERYIHQIYGLRDVGGTSFMYLSSVPFEQLGFRTDLGNTPYPEYSKGFLFSVPVILILWPAILMGLFRLTRRRNNGGNGKD